MSGTGRPGIELGGGNGIPGQGISRQRAIWWISAFALFLGLAFSQYAFSGDIKVFHDSFFRLIRLQSIYRDCAGDFYEMSYLPGYSLIMGPMYWLAYWFRGWEYVLFFYQLPGVACFVLNVFLVSRLGGSNGWLIALILVLHGYSWEFLAWGGQPEFMVLAFLLAGLAAHLKSRHFLSGLMLGLSMLKLTTLPVVLLLLGKNLYKRNPREISGFIGGLAIANLPNLAYFAWHFQEFLDLAARRWDIFPPTQEYYGIASILLRKLDPSWPSYYGNHSLWLLFIPVALAPALWLHVKNRIGLFAASAIAMSPIAFAWHGVVRPYQFLALLLIALMPYSERFAGQAALFLVFTHKTVSLLVSAVQTAYPWPFHPCRVGVHSLLNETYFLLMAFGLLLFLLVAAPVREDAGSPALSGPLPPVG